MIEQQLDDSIYELVEERDHVSMAEIERLVETIVPARGTLALTFGGFPNILIWVNMSEAFFQSMKRLLEQKRIFPHQCAALIYLIDGACPRLPIAKRAMNYKTEHWLPVVFRTVPIHSKKRKVQHA